MSNKSKGKGKVNSGLHKTDSSKSIIAKSSRSRKNDKLQTVTGRFVSNQRGFGFVEAEELEQDLFIAPENTADAFYADTVEAAILPSRSGKRQEGIIVKIVERALNQVVGTFEKSKSYGFVIPDNRKIASDIFIPKEKCMGAVDGHKVVCHLTDYGNARKNPEGEITQILGHINDPGVDIMSIVLGHDLPVQFPERVLNQAVRVAKPVSDADCNGRVDLRDVRMVTIDGEDSKDLDDAVSLTVSDGIYHLGVHIADVANYVQENSALDREALVRGTSVYLVDRVIPMLPHALCNGICSLNQGEDRLALSCIMDINEKGDITEYRIVESVINVNRRMTYKVVAELLEDEESPKREEYRELIPMFRDMYRLSGILHKKRKKRGSIDFDLPESQILLDENGHPVDVQAYDRNIATGIIEEFMLIANETVAQHFYYLETPFVYRTHETPDADKIHKLQAFVKNFGYILTGLGNEIHPGEIQKLIARVDGTPEEVMISRIALRSMKQAKYTTECSGHFGLAASFYCHFTSPIRRYPDLQIHRIIKESLRGRMNAEKIDHYNQILGKVANESSRLERRADEAQRETEKLKKVEYMEAHIGECFEGMISGITAWGVYVELPNTVEGMIPISKLPGDSYYYNEDSFEAVGEYTGRKYRLGDRMSVIVKRVDKIERVIDFDIPRKDRTWSF